MRTLVPMLLTALMMAGCARTDARQTASQPDTPAPAPGPAPASGTVTPTPMPTDPAHPVPTNNRAEAVFAGGCFWCVEAVFEELEGVHEVVSGYAGGDASTANYTAVTTGRTGHAEAVKIVYDPSIIDFATLLKVHFATHDPTTLNRQGADVGPQYRSAIFYANDEEKGAAEAFIRSLTESKAFGGPIVTTLEPLIAFHEAERYHQNYVCDNPDNPYIRGVAWPKVKKVREQFRDRLKDESPLGDGTGIHIPE